MDIVLTKLHKPSLGQHWVPRPWLLEQLEQGRERPVTLICGPAGYGKSTLVGHWLETSELPSCWLSLDNRDNELHRFLTNTVDLFVRLYAPRPLTNKALPFADMTLSNGIL